MCFGDEEIRTLAPEPPGISPATAFNPHRVGLFIIVIHLLSACDSVDVVLRLLVLHSSYSSLSMGDFARYKP
jgi:hypothetical protein